MLNIKNISKTFNRKRAISNISLKIEKGEFVFLVGKTGSGKTTLLKMLNREMLPDLDHGKILFDGLDVLSMTDREIYKERRKIGLVFQDFRLIERKTVYENVAIPLYIQEYKKKTIQKRVFKALSLVGMDSKLNNMPESLSGGEKQKVALARAIVHDPVLIIADEPTGNLDPKASFDIVNLLARINEKGTTILMATHEKGIVDSYRKRVVELSHGMIIRDEQNGKY